MRLISHFFNKYKYCYGACVESCDFSFINLLQSTHLGFMCRLRRSVEQCIYRIPLFGLAEEWGRGRNPMACVTPVSYCSDGSLVES